jgi:hypothetical protein
MTNDPTNHAGFLPDRMKNAGRAAGGIGLIALAACCVLWILMMIFAGRWPVSAAAFYKGYLFAWLFFLGVSLGAMMAVMIHLLIGGEWGYFVRRFGEAAASMMPLLFVLGIPILAGMRSIYPWADPNNHPAIIAHKHVYLNPEFFILRYVIYFAIWIANAWLLRSQSLRHDRTASKATEQFLRQISAVGLVLYFITMSLASVDWIMSLEPDWYSTVFGFIICMGQAVCGTCLLIIMLELLRNAPVFSPRLRPKHFNDLATLLITAVIMWAYTSFAQLLVIWMGNTQKEIPWYVTRSFGPWRIMALLLVYGGFLAPFVLLLQRGVKKRGNVMLWMSVAILAMQALDIYWWIAPAGAEPFPQLHWLNILTSLIALIGIGGVWIAAFLWLLNKAPLMPAGDTVPIETPHTGSTVNEPRNPDHDAESGTQPGLA